MKQFKITVRKAGEAGTDSEYIVQVELTQDGKPVGSFCLPGGDLENAKGIAAGLISLANTGFDLAEFLPESSAVIEA